MYGSAPFGSAPFGGQIVTTVTDGEEPLPEPSPGNASRLLLMGIRSIALVIAMWASA